MDQVVLALEGAIAPMDCFVDDRDGPRRSARTTTTGELCATKLLWTRVQLRRHQVAAAHHARRARRVRRPAARAPATRSIHREEPMADLEIKNLHVHAGDKQILKGVDLHRPLRRVPRPHGPQRLRQVDARQRRSWATRTSRSPRARSSSTARTSRRPTPTSAPALGLFMAFQYPVAIPGVTVTKYLRMVMNAHREARGEERDLAQGLPQDGRGRDGADQGPAGVLHAATSTTGFSGGEKKRMEILQLALQSPSSPSSTRPTPASTSTRSTSSPHGVNAVAAQAGMGVADHHPLPAHPAPGRARSSSTSCSRGGSSRRAARSSSSSSSSSGYGWIREEVAAAA